MHEENQVPIWYFIGWLLAVYGAIIAVYSVVTFGHPGPATMPPEIYRLHAGIWWGAGMVALGLFYIFRFPPKRKS